MSNYFCPKKSSKMFERRFFSKNYWFFTIDALPFYAVIWKFHISVFFSVTLKRFFLFFHFWTFIYFSKMSNFQNHKLLFQTTFFYKSSTLIKKCILTKNLLFQPFILLVNSSTLIKKYKIIYKNNFLHFLKTQKIFSIFFSSKTRLFEKNVTKIW